MALSAMMRQYLELKEKHRDEILMFRVGDFYEMFFDDARTASRELELTLTGKDCGLEERAPMAGVPYHAVDTYVKRLVAKGYRVAICEQLTDPAESKGLVERDVTRVITAGTLTDEKMLEEKESSYLLSIAQKGKKAGLAFCDISTGEFYVCQISDAPLHLADEVARISPKEVLAQASDEISALCDRISAVLTPRDPSAFDAQKAQKLLKLFFGDEAQLAKEQGREAVLACGALLDYIEETQKSALKHINHIKPFDSGLYMLIDRTAAINLELTGDRREMGKRGSLFGVIDQSATAMGGRLLKSWLVKPLMDEDKINSRLDGVEYFTKNPHIAQELKQILKGVYDIERLLSRIALGSESPRDCLSLAQTLERVPQIHALLSGAPGVIAQTLETLDPIEDLSALLQSAIREDAPVLTREGGIFKPGFNQSLDTYHEASLNGKEWLSQLEAKEREETGIKNLKIGYNRLFGYYIEVTKSYYELIPLRYTRKQTLAACERFVTEELKQLENTILGAEENAIRLETELFSALREELKGQMERISKTAQALKTLDALNALALSALDNNYVRPSLNREGRYEIINGRHPVVERARGAERFVPNDTHLTKDARVMIITGPNMAGKSTYMRQVALIVILAQMGSFVPADSADISITDRVFTRIGASDELYMGRSTFMVEMDEMSVILKNATSQSLVLLDEVGRGTSTFDGLSIAWAAVEHLANEKCGARTLFATHYHELSVLEGQLDGVVNYRVTATEKGDDVIFLRKVVPGGEDKSYGIAVAKLAGLPREVIARARQIMARLEVSDEKNGSLGQSILNSSSNSGQRQLSIEDFRPMELVEELQTLDVMGMSPIDALNYLFKLCERAKRL